MAYLQTPTHFDDVIEQLEHETGPDEKLDEHIHDLVLANRDVLDRLMPMFPLYGNAYTSSFDAMALIVPGWWWHVSHLGASVIPNRPDPQIPMSNAIDYTRQGRPIEYHSQLWGDERAKIPRAIAAAALKTHRALFLKCKSIDDNRMYLTQTGHGPRLILADGRITEIPYQSWLDESGKLVARHIMFPDEPKPEILPEDDEKEE